MLLLQIEQIKLDIFFNYYISYFRVKLFNIYYLNTLMPHNYFFRLLVFVNLHACNALVFTPI
jgi:hypothetical protein